VSYDASGRLDTKTKNKENNLKFLFILIFENYFNFYFNLKYFYYFFENDVIEM